MKQGLFDQGYLDEQFIQIEMLQDETSPNFVEDVLMLFLRDSTKLVNDIEQTLIGAHRVKNECWRLREFCEECNVEGAVEEDDQLAEEVSVGKGEDGLRIGGVFGDLGRGVEGVVGDDDGADGEDGEERGMLVRQIRRRSWIPLQRIRAGYPIVDSVGSSSSSSVSSWMMLRRVRLGILAAEEEMERRS
ncbi:Histidine-containing phosphotransfer protein 4 [Acorus calamus]|uniref:Histidine-containing phosphotransfer protein n=1 Tax=Acorus calamus TaxID=4465 RepID=A0AAV9D211_ACOCL|nr:Histidine-containing phosphotransfer protein 4 [Acorus calamus]